MSTSDDGFAQQRQPKTAAAAMATVRFEFMIGPAIGINAAAFFR
jgi:hypothetical protein